MSSENQAWKELLRARCAEAIERLEIRPPTLETEPEPPSLYDFHADLAALRNELRKGNRKTAETFSRFGDVLESMQADSGKLREFLAAAAKPDKTGKISRNLALGLIDIADRLERLETAAELQAESGLLALARAENRWRKQTEALEIVRQRLHDLLAHTGIQRIESTGQPFDPLWMKAVAGEQSPSSPAQTRLIVAEELLAGYRMGEDCLRPAEVRLRASETPAFEPANPPS